LLFLERTFSDLPRTDMGSSPWQLCSQLKGQHIEDPLVTWSLLDACMTCQSRWQNILGLKHACQRPLAFDTNLLAANDICS